ncbi:transposase family protein [Gordonia rhizosphera]|uniref:transposase family protein n=1 Tax=Gordonia rhizosphera TaxID=83341 RepID=UPI00357162BB
MVDHVPQAHQDLGGLVHLAAGGVGGDGQVTDGGEQGVDRHAPIVVEHLCELRRFGGLSTGQDETRNTLSLNGFGLRRLNSEGVGVACGQDTVEGLRIARGRVVDAEFTAHGHGPLVLVRVEAHARARSRCPHCNRVCGCYDRADRARRWRHLDIGGTRCFGEARVSRLRCARHASFNGPTEPAPMPITVAGHRGRTLRQRPPTPAVGTAHEPRRPHRQSTTPTTDQPPAPPSNNAHLPTSRTPIAMQTSPRPILSERMSPSPSSQS